METSRSCTQTEPKVSPFTQGPPYRSRRVPPGSGGGASRVEVASAALSSGLRASVGPWSYLSMPGIDQIPAASVDFRGRLRRTANVQDHVPRSVLRGIDAERHLSLPTLVDGREDLAKPLAILLREVHDTQVEVELILRWVAAMESQRYRAVELVFEPRERVQHISKELLVFEWFERIETGHLVTHRNGPPNGSTGGPPKPSRPLRSSGTCGPRIAPADRRPDPSGCQTVTRAKDTARRIPEGSPRTGGRPDGCTCCPGNRRCPELSRERISALGGPRTSPPLRARPPPPPIQLSWNHLISFPRKT